MSDLVELNIERPDGSLVLRNTIPKSERVIIGMLVVCEGKLILDATVLSIIQPQFPIIGDLNLSVKEKNGN